MCNELQLRGKGMTPYEWQLDVAEALLLGLDCSVVAGTGAGQILPFILPLLVEINKVVVIISPLNALEEDQAARFNKLGLSAVAVNGGTYNSTPHKRYKKNMQKMDKGLKVGSWGQLQEIQWEPLFLSFPSVLFSNSPTLKGIVVVEEAYIDFVDDPLAQSAASLVKRYANLCVMQTLRKSFGLPAIRLGIALAQQPLVQILTDTKAPYNTHSGLIVHTSLHLSHLVLESSSTGDVGSLSNTERRCIKGVSWKIQAEVASKLVILE